MINKKRKSKNNEPRITSITRRINKKVDNKDVSTTINQPKNSKTFSNNLDSNKVLATRVSQLQYSNSIKSKMNKRMIENEGLQVSSSRCYKPPEPLIISQVEEVKHQGLASILVPALYFHSNNSSKMHSHVPRKTRALSVPIKEAVSSTSCSSMTTLPAISRNEAKVMLIVAHSLGLATMSSTLLTITWQVIRQFARHESPVTSSRRPLLFARAMAQLTRKIRDSE